MKNKQTKKEKKKLLLFTSVHTRHAYVRGQSWKLTGEGSCLDGSREISQNKSVLVATRATSGGVWTYQSTELIDQINRGVCCC